jgi:signal transduction histidine kinase
MSESTTTPSVINNRYEVKETLWTGGMGDVYRVYDRQTQREMFLKLLDGDHPIAPSRLHRFKTEFRRTPNLVPQGAWEVYDTGLTERGLYYMTLEAFSADAVPGAGSASAAAAPAAAYGLGAERSDWQEVLAEASFLEGAALKRVLGWVAARAGAERAVLKVLDAEGQDRDLAVVGETLPVLDQARYCLERVRYDRQLCEINENGQHEVALPIQGAGQLVGLLYAASAPNGKVRPEVLKDVVGDLALALLKDRRLHKAQEDTRHLEMLNALSRTISATLDLPQILNMVLVEALEVSEADNGAVFWGPEQLAALDRHGRPIDDLRVSQSVVSQVLEEGRSLSILDTMEDARFATQASIMDLQLRSIMCVPLRAGREIRGVLYVSSQSVNRTFGPHDLEVLEAMSAQVALALETAQSYQTIRELNAGLEEKVKARTAELAEALAELQKTQAQLVQTEKMASLGQMVAGVAHELNNPLNFIHGNLKVLKDYLQRIGELLAIYDKKGINDPDVVKKKDELDYEYMAEDLAKIIESCQKGTTRSQKIVEDLKLFSGMDEAELKPVDLKVGVESALAMVQGRFPSQTVTTELQAVPLLTGYGKQLNQAFLAVLTNALQAVAQGGEVFVKLETQGDEAVVTIRDTGVGIPAEHLSKVFDPFFTTRPVGEGSGLGLTTAYSVVERHDGEIRLTSAVGEGTTVSVRLPLAGLAQEG